MPFDAHNIHAHKLQGDERMAGLAAPQRVWAVGSLYGRYGALCQLHEVLARRLKPKDRLVYLGNYLGTHTLWTGEGIALIDELVTFRNALIGVPGFFAEDVIFLRGQREALLQQLLRLPFQKNAARWLNDAVQKGLESYVVAYGNLENLYGTIDGGIIALNRWAHGFQAQMKAHPGHAAFFDTLNSCAMTQFRRKKEQVAFVPAGFDPSLPLAFQYDELTSPAQDNGDVGQWAPFARIVRGQAFRAQPPGQNPFVLSLDGGDGLNGKLYAACLDPQGQVLDMLSF